MLATDLTVAAVVEQNGQYLMVEERAMGNRVISQPGGHIEAGETPQQAVVREVLEETGCHIECGALLGIYLWIHPQTRRQYLRLMYRAEYLSCDESLALDSAIIARLWLGFDEIAARRHSLRSPVVLRCLQDEQAGKRPQDGLLEGLVPLQHNVHKVLANADLI